GVGDLAVGAPGAAYADAAWPVPPAEVDLVSGASGALLRRLPQPHLPKLNYPNGFGATLATVPVPGGLPHLLVGRRESYWWNFVNTGAMLVDLDGQLLASTQPLGIFDDFTGISVAAGDVTGDGSPELFVGKGNGGSLEEFAADLSWRNALGSYSYALF